MLAWKSVKKIDGHIHLIPDEVHKANSEAQDVFSKAKLRSYLEIMDRYNIEKAVIMPFNDPALLSMQFEISKGHENLWKILKEYPDRFYVFADIDPSNKPEKSLDLIKEAMENYAFSGIKFHPANSAIPIDSNYNDLLFEYAWEKKIGIAIHAYPNTKNDLCAVSRIRRVLSKYPKLKVMVSHMGFLEFEGLLDLDCYVDISAVLPDYVKHFGLKKTNEILRSFSVDRLIFASDWPCSRIIDSEEIYDEYYKILDFCQFSDQEIHKIAYQNILNFLMES